MTGAGSAPGEWRGRIVTRDVDVATEMTRARYVDHKPVFFGDRQGFRFELDWTTARSGAGWAYVDRVRHTPGARTVNEPAADLLVVAPMEGTVVRHTVGHETTSSLYLVPYWRPGVTEWDEFDAMVGVLDLEGVRRVGAELSGLDPAQVEFTSAKPISSAWEPVVSAVLSYAARPIVPGEESVTGALLRSEVFGHLAAVLLAAFPNTTQTLRPPRREQDGSAVVRRAVAFVDAHAHDDIDITQIAAAAGTTPGGLESAFHRDRGQTPMQYLRRVRLEGTHRDLQAGDPTRGDTVVAIAARWGFRHPGRFSAEYRSIYGQTPEDTLGR